MQKQKEHNPNMKGRKQPLIVLIFRSKEAEEQKVPLAGDELDGDEEDDTLERCGVCRRGMKNGAVRYKIMTQ